jgi:hypothetical protein
MLIKIAFVVLFTAWFSSQALAQWNWQYPAPPPPPPLPPSVDQPDSLKSAPRQRRLSRPASRELARPAAGVSPTGCRQRTAEGKSCEGNSTKKRKSVANQQKANKAAATGSVTSSRSAEEPHQTSFIHFSQKKSTNLPSAGRNKAPIKPTSREKGRRSSTGKNRRP